MWAPRTWIFLLASAIVPSALAQCSINLSAIADTVLFFDPANTTEFAYTFEFNGCELETVVPEVQYPDGQSIGCTIPVNYAADYEGPQGTQTMTCPVSVGTMPAGAYNLNIFLGNGGEASVPFTITHTEVTVVAAYVTVTVPVTVTHGSTTTLSQTVTTTSLVPGETITTNIGGSQITVTKPVNTITSTSTVTKTDLETKTKTVSVTSCVPTTLVARRGRLNRRDATVTVDITLTNTVTSTVIATAEVTTTALATITDTRTATPITTTISAMTNTVTVAGSTTTSILFTTITSKQHTTITETKAATVTGRCS